MSTVHFTLQGKGGVGKSVVATLLAQYLKDKGIAAKCFDADPLNQTFGGFAALGVTKVDLMETTEKGRRINPRRFDDLVEQIALQPGESHVIVDTGSSSFVALVQSLNAALRAARDSTAALVEEAVRTNAGAVRAAVQDGIERFEQALTISRRIAWVSLAASLVALVASLELVLVRLFH
jgi:adenylylsulfate kinase-like enzyme